jgi:hypothetical protein
MTAALDFLAGRWLALTFLLIGLAGLVVVALLRRRLESRFVPMMMLCVAATLPGAGALLPLAGWGVWIAGPAAGVLFVMAVLLLAAGLWNKWAALATTALLLIGLGALVVNSLNVGFNDLFAAVRTVEFVHPLWLLLLLLIPAVFAMNWRGLTRFESVRPWASVVLRTLGISLLAIALSEPRVRETGEHVAVLFLLDRSESIPEELVDVPGGEGQKDLRAERVMKFINDAVENRGAGHERDKAGLIVFGKRPRLEYPPSDASRHWLRELPNAADGSYTDIAAALKMALASFPEGSSKRVVLLSDGNENLGNAEEQARLAKSLGVQIDVVPLASGQRNEDEVLIERVEAPSQIEQGGKAPIRVMVRSYNPNIVVGKLTLKQITEGESRPVGQPATVRLKKGLNPFSFSRQLTDEQRSYTYEAEFQPEAIEDEDGKVLHKGRPPGDRVQNNRASAHVVARGQRRILVLWGAGVQEAANIGKARPDALIEGLLAAGDKKFKIVDRPIDLLAQHPDPAELAAFLSNFDCVVLVNVASDEVSNAAQEVLRSNTHDQGCGLIMVGGPQSFGAGGWQDTAVEKALPVDCDIKSLMVQGKGGLVLIMHGCEMSDGNVWEKRIAKLAIQRLGPSDHIGVIDGNQQWHIKLQEIGDNKEKLLAQVDGLIPGDMMDFDRPLTMAYNALMEKDRNLSVRHVIIISDGDPQQTDPKLLPSMKRDKVSVSTVGVATHSLNEDKKMKTIADATGGKAHSVKSANQLPAIYIKETRLVAQSFVDRKVFKPVMEFRSGPTEGLPEVLDPIKGYVRTTAKPQPLVEIPIDTPPFADQKFPILAHWRYGLGKGVAFTSDAGSPEFWTQDWQAGGIYRKFWEKVVDWSLRPTESGNLTMTTEVRDGKIHILVDARTPDGKYDDKLTIRVGVTAPGAKQDDAGGGAGTKVKTFDPIGPGQYTTTVNADEAGSYFLNAAAVRKTGKKGPDDKDVEEPVDSVRAGVTLPYSPEFSELETNEPLLRRLAEMTDGKVYKDADADLEKVAKSGDLFRPGSVIDKGKQPVWQWLLFAAGLLLFVDVAVRRLSVDVQKAGTAATRAWMRLRGIPLPPDEPEYLERLQTRKAATGAAVVRSRAGRRFEATGEYAEAPPIAGTVAAPPAARPQTRPDSPGPGAPEAPAAADDYAARLFEAKRRARRDKDKAKE